MLAKDAKRTGRLAWYGSVEETYTFFGKSSMEEILKSIYILILHVLLEILQLIINGLPFVLKAFKISIENEYVYPIFNKIMGEWREDE